MALDLASSARRNLPALARRYLLQLARRPHAELNLTIHYEDAGEGWVTATVEEVPGAISQGRTREEARENVIDALVTVLTPDDHLAGEPLAADEEPLTLTVS